MAAVRQLLEEHDVDMGAMFELNGSRKALDPVVQWFRSVGYEFKVLAGPKVRGEASDCRPKNSLGIFFKKSKYKVDRKGRVALTTTSKQSIAWPRESCR